ncbi:MAG: TonB-dependent receptor [Flavobacteriaceae bacterium]|nr:TonB-dependent receptor [Flavobacteriaceae bacterium]
MSNSLSLSAYLQEEYNLTENFNLTGGLRFTKHEVFGLNIAPKISILKKWEHFNVRASWSLGFKTPEINELHYRYKRDMMGGLKLFLGNKDLKPETSNYFSLATEYKTTDFSITASAYLNKLKDMITLIGIPTPYAERDRELDKTLQYRNVENATIKGIELMTKYNLPYNIKVGGSYSFLDAKGNFLNEDEEIENRIINYTSKHKGSVYALWNHSWQKYGFGVGVFGKGQSKRYHYEYGDADAYMLFRLNTEHKFMHFKNCNIEVNAGIDNILDYKETKPYGYHYATTTPGRTFYVSLFINFKK